MKNAQQFEFYQIQTPQLIDNASRPCGLNVCSTILHVKKISIERSNYNLKGYVTQYAFDMLFLFG
jgi:hypothetical protein